MTRTAPSRLSIGHATPTILLVEDNPADVRMVELMLEETSFSAAKIVLVTTLREAVDRLRTIDVDCVLLDLSLPDADNLEGVVAIITVSPETPVVILTGIQDESLALAAMREGAQDYLLKGSTDAVRLERSVRLAIGRKDSEWTVRASESLLRATFDHTALAIAICDLEGNITDANAALERMLERDAGLVGSLWFSHIHPDDRPSHLVSFAALMDDAAPAFEPEEPHRFLRASGADGWAQVTIVLVRDGSGRPSRFICQLHDVTARKVQQDRLEEVVRSKDEFVASVSHELRTPLTVVLGLSEELRDGLSVFDPSEVSELVDLIASQALEVSSIVEDLLVAARADIGKVTISPALTDLAAEARAVIEATAPERLAQATLGDSVAWADKVRVRQILRNLISNAVRYGGENIFVETRHDGEAALLLVRDDGPGIPIEEQTRIFAPYYRTHTAASQPASVGLGLTVSQKLAELMNGGLSYSTADGLSTFELRLPAARV